MDGKHLSCLRAAFPGLSEGAELEVEQHIWDTHVISTVMQAPGQHLSLDTDPLYRL